MNRVVIWKFSFFSSLLVLLATAGCSSGTAGDRMIADANRSNVQRLCNMYNYYQAKNDWKGPPSEKAFKEFVASQQPKNLERMGIKPSDIDSMFVSERDGLPFLLRYGVAGNSRGSREPVVFEAVGVDGKRIVGFTSTEQMEVDEQKYEELMNSAAK